MTDKSLLFNRLKIAAVILLVLSLLLVSGPAAGSYHLFNQDLAPGYTPPEPPETDPVIIPPPIIPDDETNGNGDEGTEEEPEATEEEPEAVEEEPVATEEETEAVEEEPVATVEETEADEEEEEGIIIEGEDPEVEPAVGGIDTWIIALAAALVSGIIVFVLMRRRSRSDTG
jgi:hypothetical protein